MQISSFTQFKKNILVSKNRTIIQFHIYIILIIVLSKINLSKRLFPNRSAKSWWCLTYEKHHGACLAAGDVKLPKSPAEDLSNAKKDENIRPPP